jgi:HEAT repeat protein
MPKPRKIDVLLDELSAFLREGSAAPDAGYLNALLAHRDHLVVARAAACAARHRLATLVDAIAASWDRCALDGATVDKTCAAKKAIVKALDALAFDDSSWFAQATTCVQMEPVYGGSVDTGAEVRRAAIAALGRFPWYAVSHVLVRRLGDAEASVRMAAIDRIASFSGREPELIVLTKTIAGDALDEVMGACFRALLGIDTTGHLGFVAGYLTHESETVQTEAAFAIAESRHESAFAILSDAWETGSTQGMRASLLPAISILRNEQSADFLRNQLNDRRFGNAAREALASYPEHLKEKAP